MAILGDFGELEGPVPEPHPWNILKRNMFDSENIA